MWGFVVDCLKGVSQGACRSSQVCVLARERRHRHAHLQDCVCQAPEPWLWGVVGADSESGVGAWFGSGEQGVPEKAHPFFPPFLLPLSLPFVLLFTPHNLLVPLDPSWQALAGSWHPGLQAQDPRG